MGKKGTDIGAWWEQLVLLPYSTGSTGSQTTHFLLPTCTPGLYLYPFLPTACYFILNNKAAWFSKTGVLPQHYMASQPSRPQLE